MNTNNIDNNRRDFLKKVGVGAAASAVVLSGCGSDKNPANGESITAQGEIPKDQMTYRINPKTGEKVSLLGYGCMRWPTKKIEKEDGTTDEVIDQEMVNRLIDTAL